MKIDCFKFIKNDPPNITQLATYVILDARTPFLREKQSFF